MCMDNMEGPDLGLGYIENWSCFPGRSKEREVPLTQGCPSHQLEVMELLKHPLGDLLNMEMLENAWGQARSGAGGQVLSTWNPPPLFPPGLSISSHNWGLGVWSWAV